MLLPDGGAEVPVEDLQRRVDARERLPRRAGSARARCATCCARKQQRAASSRAQAGDTRARRDRAACKEHGISQMPVLERRRAAGGPGRRGRPARTTWCKSAGGLDAPDRRAGRGGLRDGDAATRDPAAAQHLQRRQDGRASIERDDLVGVITKIDLIEYLAERRAMKRDRRAAARAATATTTPEAPTDASVRDAGDPRRPDARSDHRRGDDAGLLDLDLRADGPGRAQGLRVLAHAEPDALRARGATSRRSRAARWGLASRRAAPRRPRCCTAATRATTSSPATISTAARSACSTRCSAGSGSSSPTSTRATRARSPRRSRPTTQARVGRDADQPAAQAVRHRAPSPTSARARGVLLRRRQHLHDAVLPAAARARRRPGRALDDEVPERPLRRRRRRGHRRATPTLRERLAFLQNAIGAVPSPMDCFLVLRGTKTLPVRMERHAGERARGRRAGSRRAARSRR